MANWWACNFDNYYMHIAPDHSLNTIRKIVTEYNSSCEKLRSKEVHTHTAKNNYHRYITNIPGILRKMWLGKYIIFIAICCCDQNWVWSWLFIARTKCFFCGERHEKKLFFYSVFVSATFSDSTMCNRCIIELLLNKIFTRDKSN